LAEATKDKQYFYNFVLGLPYKGSDVVVDRETIVKNIVLTENKRLNVAMGVDNGIVKHYVIGNEEGIFEMGETKDWKDIEDLIKKYNATTVIDLNPYPKMPKSLAQKYRAQVFCSFYKRDKDRLGTFEWGKKDKLGMVYSDRNKIIQEVIDVVVDGGVNYNMVESALEEYIAHWDNMYQVVEEDALGVPHAVWKTVENRPDHYAHATVYWYLAMIRAGSKGGVVSNKVKPLKGKPSFYVENGGVKAQDIGAEIKFAKPKKDWIHL